MRLSLRFSVSLACLAAPAMSAHADPLPPFLSYLQSRNVTESALGPMGGLDGYLIKAPDGREQTIYLTPDGDHAVVGILVGKTGENLTGKQLDDLRRRITETQTQLDSASKVAADTAVSSGIASSTPPSDLNAPVDTASAPQGAGPTPSSINKDTFLSGANATAWFSVGKETAPVLWMIADPQCPACHAAWKDLQPFITQGKLQVKIILMAGLDGSDKLVDQLLSNPRVGEAWMAGEGSADGVPVKGGALPGSKRYAEAAAFMQRNLEFARSVMKVGTPLLAYVGKDGKLYSMESSNHIPAFLGAM